MAVTAEFRAFALEQLGRVVPVTARAMFGGVGVYGDGLFFALLDDDVLYLKTDDGNRPDFEARGMQPFRPFGQDANAMAYHELPPEVLEDHDELRPWVEGALAAARRKGRRGGRRV